MIEFATIFLFAILQSIFGIGILFLWNADASAARFSVCGNAVRFASGVASRQRLSGDGGWRAEMQPSLHLRNMVPDSARDCTA